MLTPDYHHEVKMEEKYYLGKKVKEYYHVFNRSRLPVPVKNILDRGTHELTGRKIIKYSIILGDHEDGSGPGFLGVLLNQDAHRNLPVEWLVITVAGAGDFCLLDNEWVEASAAFFNIKKPLIRYEGPKFIDKFGPVVAGSVIKSVNVKTDSCVIILEKDGSEHKFEILNEDSRLSSVSMLPPDQQKDFTVKSRAIFPTGDHIGNYIIFMEEDGQIYV